jgi:predicted RNA-binding Zn ribbon-like protein
MVNEEHRWEAPGRLELVRAFLNTEPPRGAEGEDRLKGLLADQASWAETFPGVPRRPGVRPAELAELRAGLRGLLEGANGAEQAAWLDGWFARTGLGPVATAGGGELLVRLACPPGAGLAGAVVEAVAAAVADGAWPRLKQCPDCRLVFWDRTRNASKVWCGMYAGADGRACGSIAKVRRYRARRGAAGRR